MPYVDRETKYACMAFQIGMPFPSLVKTLWFEAGFTTEFCPKPKSSQHDNPDVLTSLPCENMLWDPPHSQKVPPLPARPSNPTFI